MVALQPKERGILLRGPLVVQTLRGIKGVTRRPVRPQPFGQHYLQPMWGTSPDGFAFGTPGLWREVGPDYPDGHEDDRRCPYGAAGDLLYVKETWTPADDEVFGLHDHVNDPPSSVLYRADNDVLVFDTDPPKRAWNAGHERLHDHPKRWKSARFMPKWASRLRLEITDVRAERLHAITPGEVLLEGAVARGLNDQWLSALDDGWYTDLRALFAAGWDRIHADHPGERWADNPWVWRVAFRVERRWP